MSLGTSYEMTMSEYTEAARLFGCKEAGLMSIEILYTFAERRCSITTGSEMNILHGKPFYIYIANLIANPLNEPKFRVVVTESNFPTCIIHARDDESHMLKGNSPAWTKYETLNTNTTVDSGPYRRSERQHEEVDLQNAVKIPGKSSKTD